MPATAIPAETSARTPAGHVGLDDRRRPRRRGSPTCVGGGGSSSQVALGLPHRARCGWRRGSAAARRGGRPRTRCCRRRCRSRASRSRRSARPAGGAEEGQPRLLVAGDRARVDAEALPQRGAELLAVVGVAHRAGRHGHDARRRRGGRSARGSRRAPRRPAPSPRRASRPLRSTPCPSRVTFVRRSSSRTAPSCDLGHEQPRGVRAEVDDRDALWPPPRPMLGVCGPAGREPWGRCHR